MSGTGYRKYRCKYWLIHRCGNRLLAAGRDEAVISPFQYKSSSTTYTDTNITSTQPASISQPAPPGHWFIQEPGQKWSERWASATSDEKNKYAFELANSEGGMDLMRTNFPRDVKAPEHWVHDDIV